MRKSVNHLSTVELLLLAEGELDEVRAAHAAACAECRAASTRVIAEVGLVSAALAADSPRESADAKAASFARLRIALQAGAKAHIQMEDLLLHLDGETVPTVSEHLEGCGDCHGEFLRAQTLLSEVEHELRALIPEETPRQRLASAARLERALDACRSRVLTFPAPWRAVYAAAALLAAGLFSFAWQARQPLELEFAASAPLAPTLTLSTPVRPSPAPVTQATADAVPAVVATATVPERFEASLDGSSLQPPPSAVQPQAAPPMALVAESAYAAEVELPPLQRPFAEPPTETVQQVVASVPTSVTVQDRPIGGLVRTALLEHYNDAARRSFRTARPDLLEGEVARYVSEVLHADSELLRHAYALHEMLDSTDVDNLDQQARNELRAGARRTLSAVRTSEKRLYTKLSEALPRRYWATKGAREGEAVAPDLSADSRALLNAALKLDQNLSAILVSGDSAVRLEAEPASLGELLYVVRSSSRNLQERLSVLR